MIKFILVASFIISFLIRLYFILISKQVADVHLLYMAALTFLQGQNPYLVYDYYVYPPPAIFLTSFSLYLTGFLPIPFHMLLKLWPNLADFLSAILIYKYLIKTKATPLTASFWTSLFILNPISIITSSSHGQFDPIFTFLVLIAVILINSQQTIRQNISFLLLGLAITIKPFPILLTPFFIFSGKSSKKNIIKKLILVISPLALTLTPFLLQNPLQAMSRIATYSGSFDMGLSAILRGIWFQINASLDIPKVGDLLSINKWALLSIYLAAVLVFANCKNLARSIVLTFLIFITFNFGVSVQYLVWLIPFAAVLQDKMVVLYIFLGSLAQLGFYLFLAQNILLGNLSTDAPLQVKNIYLYFFGNLFFWIFSIVWLIRIFKTDTTAQFIKLSLWRKRGIFACAAILLILLFFELRIIAQIIKQFFDTV